MTRLRLRLGLVLALAVGFDTRPAGLGRAFQLPRPSDLLTAAVAPRARRMGVRVPGGSADGRHATGREARAGRGGAEQLRVWATPPTPDAGPDSSSGGGGREDSGPPGGGKAGEQDTPPWSSAVEEILAGLEKQQPELWNSTMELLAALPLDVLQTSDRAGGRKELQCTIESAIDRLNQRLELLERELAIQGAGAATGSSAGSAAATSVAGTTPALANPNPNSNNNNNNNMNGKNTSTTVGAGALRGPAFVRRAVVFLQGPNRFASPPPPAPALPAGGIGPLQKRISGKGVASATNTGVYLYLFDASPHAAGTAVAGFLLGLLMERLLMPTGSWLLSGCLGAYACVFWAGSQTSSGQWLQANLGRRFDRPLQLLWQRFDEIRFLWKTGEVSYQWSKRMQPVIRDWQLEERIRQLGSAGRLALDQANQVERRYRVGDRLSSTVRSVGDNFVSFWERTAPNVAQRFVLSCGAFVDAQYQKWCRAMETDRQRRDRLLKEYRVGFLGRRKWRRFDD